MSVVIKYPGAKNRIDLWNTSMGWLLCRDCRNCNCDNASNCCNAIY